MHDKGLDQAGIDHINQGMIRLVLNNKLENIFTISVLHQVQVNFVLLLIVDNKVILPVLNVQKDVFRGWHISVKRVMGFLIDLALIFGRDVLDNVTNVILDVLKLRGTVNSLLINHLKHWRLLVLKSQYGLRDFFHCLFCLGFGDLFVEHGNVVSNWLRLGKVLQFLGFHLVF